MKRVAVLMCGVLLVGQAGCSMFAGSMQNIGIATHPEADVFVDGAKVGKGSITYSVRRDQSHVVMARLGTKSVVVGLGTKMSTPGTLDLVGGIFLFFPALLGLLTPGAWSLDRDAITLPFDAEAATEVKK